MSGTSGTYTFSPSGADVVLDAYERCGVRDFDSDDETNHAYVQSARRSMNFVCVRWASLGVNLWTVGLISAPLSIGSSPLTVDPSVMNVLDVYISQAGVDLLLFPLSRDDYAAIPNKAQTGRPTSYWFDRLQSPKIYLWQQPDQNNTYTLNYWVCRRLQDTDVLAGQIPDLHYRFLEAYTAAVAAHLAMKWAPDRALALNAYAQQCFAEAQAEDREKVPTRLTPDLSSYFN